MDIQYRTIKPIDFLKNVVKNFFVVEGDAKVYNMFEFADYYPKLFFIKEGQIGFCRSYNIKKTTLHNGRVVRVEKKVPVSKQPIALLGPNNDYCLIKIEGKINIIGVEFQPTGLWYFLNKSVDEYADNLTFLTDEMIMGVNQLTQMVINSNNIDDSISAISTFLISKMSINTKDADNINSLNQIINDIFQFGKESELVENANNNSKKMLRLFKRYIGISPMHFFHIFRFKNVLKLLAQYRKTDEIEQIVQKELYYDISHLSKDTKRLAGHAPNLLQETGNIIKLKDNMAIVYQDTKECTFCIYSH